MSATVALAGRWVGTKEQGYNVVPGVTDRFGLNGQSWCLMWVHVVLAEAGWTFPRWWPGTFRCDDLSRAAHRNGATRPLDEGKPGDVVVFSWYPWRYENSPAEPIIRGSAEYEGWPAGDHVGIITAPLADGHYATIEGNTSSGAAGSQSDGDGVYERRRPLGAVCCIIPTGGDPDALNAASAATATVVPTLGRMLDYSFGRPDLAAARAAGFGGVIRYVPGPGEAASSPADLTAAEVRELEAAGMAIAGVWQTTGQGASIGRWEAAVAGARAVGLAPGTTLFTAVDYDASWDEIQGHATRFIRGVRDAGYTPGVYGGRRVIDGLPDGVIGWQTVAWSGGQISQKAHLFQQLPAVMFGAEVDPNDVLRPFPVHSQAEADVLNEQDKTWIVQVVSDSLANSRAWTIEAVKSMLDQLDYAELVDLVRHMAETQVATTTSLRSIHDRLVALERPGRPEPVRYVVAAGDTVLSIARRFGVSPPELAALNGLQPGVGLDFGQVLVIPTGAEVAAA